MHWKYKVLPLAEVAAILRADTARDPDSFLAMDAVLTALLELRDNGYRWVRSDGEWAIFERPMTDPKVMAALRGDPP